MAKHTSLEEIVLALLPLMNDLSAGLIEGRAHAGRRTTQGLIGRYLLIRVCGFLDEWELLEGHGKDPRIRRILDLARPAIRRIRDPWPGLFKLRHTLLAHSSRRKDGRLAFSGENYFREIKAPSSFGEWYLLAELAVYAMRIAIRELMPEYHSGYRKMVEAEAQSMSNPRNWEPTGIMQAHQYEGAIEAVRGAVLAMDPSLQGLMHAPMVLDGDWALQQGQAPGT